MLEGQDPAGHTIVAGGNGPVAGQLAPGAIFAGKYRIEQILGQGGMGVVFRAAHLQLGQHVAIKLLLPELLAHPHVVQRFQREAQAAARLRGEHVARVIDVDVLPSGAPFIVLELLEGCDLEHFPRQQLSVGLVVDLMLQACEALAEAHSLGIVHRDIKPSNFFVVPGADGAPCLKLIDFGISKSLLVDNKLTATQAVMGTPAYMSPEQMRASRDVDHRTDLWSLGVVLYELLQGALPFGGDTFSSLVLQVAAAPLPRLTVALPSGLDDVVYRCLEKEPARRIASAAELALALAPYAGSPAHAQLAVQRSHGFLSPQGRSPSGLGHQSGAFAHGTAFPSMARGKKSRRGLWLALAGAVVVAAALGVGIVVGRGADTASGTAGTSQPGTPTNPEPAVTATAAQPPPPASPPAPAPAAAPIAAAASPAASTEPTAAAAPLATAATAAPAEPGTATAPTSDAPASTKAAPPARDKSRRSRRRKDEASASKPATDDILDMRN